MSKPPTCPRCGVEETSATVCHACGGAIDPATAECEECGWESRKALQEIAAREEAEGEATMSKGDLCCHCKKRPGQWQQQNKRDWLCSYCYNWQLCFWRLPSPTEMDLDRTRWPFNERLASGVPESMGPLPAAFDLSDKVNLLVENDQLRQRLARLEQRLAEHEDRLAMLEGLEDQRAEGREATATD